MEYLKYILLTHFKSLRDMGMKEKASVSKIFVGKMGLLTNSI